MVEKTVQVKKTIKVCDFCKKEPIPDYEGHCYICGKDVCNHCNTQFNVSGRDYDETACPVCIKGLDPFLKKRDEAQTELDNKMEELIRGSD